jgi:hypothetical protein
MLCSARDFIKNALAMDSGVVIYNEFHYGSLTVPCGGGFIPPP